MLYSWGAFGGVARAPKGRPRLLLLWLCLCSLLGRRSPVLLFRLYLAVSSAPPFVFGAGHGRLKRSDFKAYIHSEMAIFSPWCLLGPVSGVFMEVST